MSLEAVETFLAERAPDLTVTPLTQSSSTEWLATAWGIQPGQVAKTLALELGHSAVLVLSCGDSRLDNRRLRRVFGERARLLSATRAAELTGHPVGGVCPFALEEPLPVYLDFRLRRFSEVVTAAGSTHAALRIDPLRLAELVDGRWVDVCREESPLAGGAVVEAS